MSDLDSVIMRCVDDIWRDYDEDGSGSDAEDFYEGVLPMGDRSRGACFKLRSFKIQVILYQVCLVNVSHVIILDQPC